MPQVKPNVKLICYTANPDQVVASAAKLCYSDADIEDLLKGVQAKDQQKFIQRLIAMGHHSTIEHVSFTFGIEGVSRALLAQITRHRIASFSVKSQRYVGVAGKGTDGGFNYIIPPAIVKLGQESVDKYMLQMSQIQEWYDDWCDVLGNNGDKTYEDARFILPNAAETKFIVTMNARELIHFFRLRCCNRAQWEIREVAWEMLKIVLQVSPNLFSKAGPGCINGNCPEGKMSCGHAIEVRERQNRLLEEAKKNNNGKE